MLLKREWIEHDSWIACFDILGFKELAKFDGSSEFSCKYILEDYEKILEDLVYIKDDDVSYCWISDTFIFYTKDVSRDSFIAIKDVATRFIECCLRRLVPIRGAINAGHLVYTPDHRIFMGSGFIEAFVYAEDQNWIGLLLTEKALAKTKTYDREVNITSFIASEEIPMRKIHPLSVKAYKFQSGKQTFINENIRFLELIKNNSDKSHHEKYDLTIKFISDHHDWL